MKAIVQRRYGPAETLELADIDPPVPRKGQVLVRVHAAGVDKGVWHLMVGTPYVGRLAFGLRRPRTPVLGFDLAGRVEAVGEGVTGFDVGDEVFGASKRTFAELAVAPQDKLVHKPTGILFEQAATLSISGVTALQALRDVAKVQAGQQVLVIGAGGGVGTFAVQIAKSFGAEVTGVCSSAKVDLVHSIGADHVTDYTTEDIAEMSTRYDVVVDIAGNRSLSTLCRLLTPKGTLVIVGGDDGGAWFGGIDRNLRAMIRSLFVRQRLRAPLSRVRRADMAALADMVERGEVVPVIDRTYPLDQAATALHRLETGDVRGKVVLTVGSPS